jgi:allantoicase
MIIALGARGLINKIILDTCHFKGNFPDRMSIQAADLASFGDALTDAIVTDSMFWQTLLPERPLTAHAEHLFAQEILGLGPVTHVRLNIFPDGGVSRLRAFGTLA